MGFYKGNGIRSLHILMFHRLNSDLRFWSEGAFPEFTKQIKAIPCAQEFLLELRASRGAGCMHIRCVASVHTISAYAVVVMGVGHHPPRNAQTLNMCWYHTSPTLWTFSRMVQTHKSKL